VEQAFPRDYRPSNVLSVVYARMASTGSAVLAFRGAAEPGSPLPVLEPAQLRGLNSMTSKVAEDATRHRDAADDDCSTSYVQRNDMAEAGRHRSSFAAVARVRHVRRTGADGEPGGKLHEADQLYALAESGARAAGLTEIADGYIVQAGLMHALLGANDAAVARVRSVLGSRNASVRLAAVQVIGLAGAPPAVLDEAQRVATEAPAPTRCSWPLVSQAQAAPPGRGRCARPCASTPPPYETGRCAGAIMRGLWLGMPRRPSRACANCRVDPFSVCYA
jgi:hypothetical protein